MAPEEKVSGWGDGKGGAAVHAAHIVRGIIPWSVPLVQSQSRPCEAAMHSAISRFSISAKSSGTLRPA